MNEKKILKYASIVMIISGLVNIVINYYAMRSVTASLLFVIAGIIFFFISMEQFKN
ncbi:MAG: hypothetical protein FWH29_04525 [Methanobrevibacter sp.]|nr:hypothetical protein [Methanobrevibacter sp.]